LSDLKKVAQQPVLEAVTKIIKYLREKGAASSEELSMNVGARTRTYYRALNSLLEAEVVIKREDGFYCWYEFMEYVTFHNELEAREALNHSRNIAKGLRFLIGEEKGHIIDVNYAVDRGYLEHAIMHLKTGYPEVYKGFYQAEKDREDILDAEARAMKRIRGDVLVSHQVLYPEHLVFIILEDIKGTLMGREPSFLESVKIVGDEVKSIGYSLAKKDAVDELRKFILEQEADIENRESCGIMINLGASYYKLRQSLEKEVKMLISIVENGSPLRGKCQLCPKVKISPAR